MFFYWDLSSVDKGIKTIQPKFDRSPQDYAQNYLIEVIVTYVSFYFNFTEIMTLFKLRFAPLLLIEEDSNKNVLPLLKNVLQEDSIPVNLVCYEQPISYWRNVFNERRNVLYHEEYGYSPPNTNKSAIVVDSVNQMALNLGWSNCLRIIKRYLTDPNIVQVILILHRDCLSHFSKLHIHLNHIASAIVTYDDKTSSKIKIQLKKNGKVYNTEESLSYDSRSNVLLSTQVVKTERKDEEPERPSPGNLTTFKIEVEETEKLVKDKLKLPYMEKINEGESKVYYEPDAVDDWDEEDPDEDLDI